jgi:hypothetical protein
LQEIILEVVVVEIISQACFPSEFSVALNLALHPVIKSLIAEISHIFIDECVDN